MAKKPAITSSTRKLKILGKPKAAAGGSAKAGPKSSKLKVEKKKKAKEPTTGKTKFTKISGKVSGLPPKSTPFHTASSSKGRVF